MLPDPFADGPYSWVSPAIGIHGRHRPWRLAGLTALVSWGALVVLATAQDLATGEPILRSLLSDLPAYARYLVAAPLLVLGAAVYLPELASVVRQFSTRGFIADADRPRFEKLVRSMHRLMVSRWTEALIVAAALVVTATISSYIYPASETTWRATVTPGGRVSIAGWWRLAVSQPLFLSLLVVLLWRMALWARFLFVVSRLELEMVAAHPDRLGGLRFVMIPLRGFLIVAFAMGAVLAAGAAQAILFDGQIPGNIEQLLALQLMLSLGIFAGPYLTLAPKLFQLQVRGILEYGQLATEVGHAFQDRWMKKGIPTNTDEALAAPDFSATTDLFSIVANVRNINFLVLDLRTILALTIATLLPWLPVLFLLVPFEQLLQMAGRALL